MKPHSNNEQLDATIKKHYGLIVSQAVSFHPHSKDDLDEYIQVGALAMIKAMSGFDPAKGKFSTFMANCIKNAIRNHIKQNKTKTEQLVKDMSYMPRESIDEIIPFNLPYSQLEVLSLKLENYTIKEIASELGYTTTQVRGILQKAYKTIREANE